MAEVENIPSGKLKCLGCGAELVGHTSPGLCPKCLLKVAMETQPASAPTGTVILSGIGTKSRGLPQPGEEFGHYAIVRLLGAGGMGAVYEAQDTENGRRVALKVLSHTLDSPGARERFLREGRLAASINHPNSVYIFGTEEIGGTPVIAMELVTGGTLQERVRDRGALPIGEAVDNILQIIEGLEAAQRIGILHRDVKPSNCFVTESGTVKIGDFGLSISTAVRTEPAITATGAFLGTPAFCSPEQLRGEELNARSDMYSVGVTLFHLLTGRTPFEAPNLVQLLATVLEQRAPSPRQFRPEIPAGLGRVVLRCLEKQPGERFKNYGDLTLALAPYSSPAPTPATLGLRLLAGAIDTAIVGGLAMVINVLAPGSPFVFLEKAMLHSLTMLAYVFVWIGLVILYFTVFEGHWGASAGKAFCRLRVVDPDRNPPGYVRALFRALIYLLPPLVPYWATFGVNPRAYLNTSTFSQTLLGLSCYAVMALLFVTARRSNGFAAIQDLLTKTRVVSRAAVSMRPSPGATEVPPPKAASAQTIGPYHVLQAFAESEGQKWYLAFDLKLLRKVWIRAVTTGTEPAPIRWRNLSRVGRLRWLTGKRSPEENWDAFEALSGWPLLELIKEKQPWGEVRYWLYDLATEIGIAEKEGSLPELGLDRVWITAEGRAKLLDFPAPGLSSGNGNRKANPDVDLDSGVSPAQRFLAEVASAALTGNVGVASASTDREVALPLPLHARTFLRGLGQLAGAEAVAVALKPLLNRTAAVSRLRRAALVAGCTVIPLLALGGGFFAFNFLHELNQKNPGLLDLSSLLQTRSSARYWGGKHAQLPSDRQFAIYIASHYRGLITNEASWFSPFSFALVKKDDRKFAEESVANYPAPTEAEIADAGIAIEKYMPKEQPFSKKRPVWLPAVIMSGALVGYVGIPALIGALAFRGGLVLLVAGVAFVRKDGQHASRLRLLWRALVAWSPSVLAFALSIFAIGKQLNWGPWAALASVGALAMGSVALPERGLQDRLAGTWPVPR